MSAATHLFLDASGQSMDPCGLPFDSLCLARGAFETMLFVSGRAVLAREHEKRLAETCEALSIATVDEVAAITAATARELADTPHERLRVRISIFAGGDAGGAAAVVTASACAEPPSSVLLGLSTAARFAGDALAAHKTAAYLQNLLVRQRAMSSGRYDDLMIDTQGNVAETSTANVFVSVGGEIVTPAVGCILPGIVRDWVLRTSRDLGIVIAERPIGSSELALCEGGFITNSIIGLTPASEMAGRKIPIASELAWFRKLRGAYTQLLSSTASGGFD